MKIYKKMMMNFFFIMIGFMFRIEILLSNMKNYLKLQVFQGFLALVVKFHLFLGFQVKWPPCKKKNQGLSKKSISLSF